MITTHHARGFQLLLVILLFAVVHVSNMVQWLDKNSLGSREEESTFDYAVDEPETCGGQEDVFKWITHRGGRAVHICTF